MNTIITIFAGIGMIITGGIFGAVALIILDFLIEKWIAEYQLWKFKRKLKHK